MSERNSDMRGGLSLFTNRLEEVFSETGLPVYGGNLLTMCATPPCIDGGR
jgi:hypothetical protein